MRTVLVLLALGLWGCPGTTREPAGGDSGGFDRGLPLFPDGRSDILAADLSGDGPQSGDGPPRACDLLTADGIALNPGCDSDFMNKGPSAVGEFRNLGQSGTAWLFTCRTKYWLFDPLAGGGKGAFTAGGKDIATALRQLQPDCAAQASDGSFLNPGCDPAIQQSGPTTLGMVRDSSTNEDSWLITAGSKYWIYVPSKAAFVAAGASVAAATQAFQPGCASLAPDGTPLNPGCDPTFQAGGPTAWGELTDPATGKLAWLFVTGPRYWLFDTASGAFTAAGANLAAPLKALQPGCGSLSSDNTPLNPGCDGAFGQSGPTAVGELVGPNGASWLFTLGRSYWLYDTGAGAFTAAGGDLAAAVRNLGTQAAP